LSERAVQLAGLLAANVEHPERVTAEQRSEVNELIEEIDQQVLDLQRARSALTLAARRYDDALNAAIDQGDV
jgi:hypothetical protein